MKIEYVNKDIQLLFVKDNFNLTLNEFLFHKGKLIACKISIDYYNLNKLNKDQLKAAIDFIGYNKSIAIKDFDSIQIDHDLLNFSI